MEYKTQRLNLLVVCVMILCTGDMIYGLSEDFYEENCTLLLPTVRNMMEREVEKEKRMGASILRLFFHDCFINGCDGSVLLDDTPTFRGEKTAGPNNNSVRGFEVVDRIKSEIEKRCPGVVSCADILAIAARDAVVLLGGPEWKVKLGRRDSLSASFSKANSGALPTPFSTLDILIRRFRAQGLSSRDLVALSGAHTIGQATCVTFRNRIYNSSNIDRSFALSQQKICPATSGSGDRNASSLDLHSPEKFDTSYFQLLVDRKGLLTSDQALFNGGLTDSLVPTYAGSQRAFYQDFVIAMVKMGDIRPLTGSSGQIRKNCRKPN